VAHNENVHNIRCDNDLWDKAVAKEPGELPERIREFLENYVGDELSIDAELKLIGKRISNIRKRLEQGE
jgi:hypothetical protein